MCYINDCVKVCVYVKIVTENGCIPPQTSQFIFMSIGHLLEIVIITISMLELRPKNLFWEVTCTQYFLFDLLADTSFCQIEGHRLRKLHYQHTSLQQMSSVELQTSFWKCRDSTMHVLCTSNFLSVVF